MLIDSSMECNTTRMPNLQLSKSEALQVDDKVRILNTSTTTTEVPEYIEGVGEKKVVQQFALKEIQVVEKEAALCLPNFQPDLDQKDIKTIKRTAHAIERRKEVKVEIKTESAADEQDKIESDRWLSKRVQIQKGKFEGMTGVVTRVDHNWIQLCLDHNKENFTIRMNELLILGTADTVAALAAPKTPKNATNTSGHGSAGTDVGSPKKHRRHARSGSSSSTSFINKKVVLPNKSLGIVRSAERNLCTVELLDSGEMKTVRKNTLQLYKEELHRQDADDSCRPSEAQVAAFREQVNRHIQKQIDLAKNRPNLIECLVKIDMESTNNGKAEDVDEDIVDLIVIRQCEVCRFEKEDDAEFCWNDKCPISPVYNVKEGGIAAVEAARVPSTPIINPLITYTVSMPVKLIGKSRKRRMSSQSPSQVKDDAATDGASYRWTLRNGSSYRSNPPPPPHWAHIQEQLSKVPEVPGSTTNAEQPQKIALIDNGSTSAIAKAVKKPAILSSSKNTRLPKVAAKPSSTLLSSKAGPGKSAVGSSMNSTALPSTTGPSKPFVPQTGFRGPFRSKKLPTFSNFASPNTMIHARPPQMQQIARPSVAARPLPPASTPGNTYYRPQFESVFSRDVFKDPNRPPMPSNPSGASWQLSPSQVSRTEK